MATIICRMQPDGITSPSARPGQEEAAFAEARTGGPSAMAESAKGWHNIQLGTMGFIGLCGMLKMGETPAGPDWLTLWSGGMWVLAFLASLVSTVMVGSVAFPLAGMGGEMPANATGRLRSGIGMTFASIGLIILSAATAWWPADSSAGNNPCDMAGGQSGIIWLQTPQGRQIQITTCP